MGNLLQIISRALYDDGALERCPHVAPLRELASRAALLQPDPAQRMKLDVLQARLDGIIDDNRMDVIPPWKRAALLDASPAEAQGAPSDSLKPLQAPSINTAVSINSSANGGDSSRRMLPPLEEWGTGSSLSGTATVYPTLRSSG